MTNIILIPPVSSGGGGVVIESDPVFVANGVTDSELLAVSGVLQSGIDNAGGLTVNSGNLTMTVTASGAVASGICIGEYFHVPALKQCTLTADVTFTGSGFGTPVNTSGYLCLVSGLPVTPVSFIDDSRPYSVLAGDINLPVMLTQDRILTFVNDPQYLNVSGGSWIFSFSYPTIS